MKAFARFKNETWCKDLAYIGKLPKDNKGVKYLLVRQDLFSNNRRRKRNENKRTHKNGSCTFEYNYKNESIQVGLDRWKARISWRLRETSLS